nr:hypothetical protein [Tanacetum cinerariifolium]GEW21948.1 hypothetical protein [Tanacetum cinerariifolium]
MAATVQNTNNMTIKLIHLAKKLIGSNFTNWYRNLRIVLRYVKKMKFVEQPIGPAPDPETADPNTIDKYYETVNLEQEVACLMFSSMSPDPQSTLEKYNAYDMLKKPKTMFEEQAKQELFEPVKVFHTCKQKGDQSVSSYLLKLKSYLDTLGCLCYAMPNKLGASLILNSLNKDCSYFIQNYNMHSIGKTIAELHAMLKLYENGAKGKDKGKNNLAYASKPKIPSPSKRDNPTKDSICHHYKEVGHWRKNYQSYQAELKKRNKVGMVVLQGLRRSKKLKHKALSLYMGNGMHATIEAIRSFDLILPSGLIIVLDNCHFAPTVTRGVVSISRLVENGYIYTFTNYGISVSKENVFNFNAIPHDGIYEIHMQNLYPNDSSTFNVSNKKVKYSLDSSYLWHCRLGHINNKRMDKLQRDEILHPTHDESLEKCKSCIFGKMAHKPFLHKVERAKDLLGLIYTDVCGPSRTMSREGASYFISLTDDFSRYGYVYLMKHKHEEYALESATRILNMVLTKKVKRMPYEIWHGKAPKLSYLRVWGCEALMKRDAPEKLDPRSIKLQKASGSHGPLKISESDEGLELIQEEETQPFESTSKEHNEAVPIEVEPQNVKVSIHRSAMIHQALDKYGFYVDVDESKWLFKKKTDIDGNVHTFKAHLVAKGYNQTYGVDYGETFSLVADIRAIRILLAIVAFYDCEIWSSVAFLILYVDDILLMENNITMLQEVKSWLCKCFYMKDLGEAAYILGIKIIHDRSKRLIALSQSAYLKKILKKFWVENSKKGYTPMMEKPDYRKSQGAKTPCEVQRMQRVPYASVVGSIMAKPEAELKVSCYADVVFRLIKTIPNLKRAEYIAAAEALMKAVWIRKFINGLDDVVPSNKRPMEMLYDNEPAIAIVVDLEILKGARNFQRKYHFLREIIQEREIVFKKVHTDDNIVDSFTKPMSFNKHFGHDMAIRIVPASSLM